MPRSSFRSRPLALAVTFPILVPILGCEPGKPAAVAPPPPTVVVATVERRDVPIYADNVARTEAKDTVEVFARVKATLVAREFAEGSVVAAGAVLYRLDPAEYRAILDSAEALVAKAEADLKLAREQVTVRTAEAGLAEAKARKVSIEAGVTQAWWRFVGEDGLTLGIDHFGASAPGEVLVKQFGLDAAGVTAKIQAWL